MKMDVDPSVRLLEGDFRVEPHHIRWLVNYLGAIAHYVSDKFDVTTCQFQSDARGRPPKIPKKVQERGWRTIVGYHPTGWHYPYSSTVESFNSEEEALEGHEKWVSFMLENRDIDPYDFKEWAYQGWSKPDVHSCSETADKVKK